MEYFVDLNSLWEHKNQKQLRNGEAYLKTLAKEVGANMNQLAKDINSEKVKTKIQQDIDEAGKFGFQGTPGFLLNGIPVKGAFPIEHFEMIIGKLKEKGKINI